MASVLGWRKPWLLVLCGVSLTMLAASAAPAASPGGEVWPPEEWQEGQPQGARFLTGTEFLNPGLKLATALVQPMSPPINALYLCKGNSHLKLNKQRDLVGQVHITSPELALRYARLFTTPYVGWFLSDWGWLELVPARAVDARYLFGNSDLLAGFSEERILEWDRDQRERLKEFEHRTVTGVLRCGGVLTNAEWDGLHLDSPRAAETPDGFIVTRWLVPFAGLQGSETSTIYQVEETVTPEGRLQRRLVAKRTLKGIILVPSPFSFMHALR